MQPSMDKKRPHSELASHGYAKYIDKLPFAALVLLRPSGRLAANQQFYKLFQIGKETLPKRGDLQKIVYCLKQHVQNGDTFEKSFAGLQRDDKTFENERFVLKDGRTLLVDYFSNEISIGATEHVWHFREIPANRISGSTASSFPQNHFAELIESIDLIVWEADPHPLRFTYVSHKAEEILGYPVRRWLEEPDFWMNHIHAEDRKWVPDFCADATAELKNHAFEYRMIARNKNIIWLKDVVTVVVENGKAAQLRGVMIDITQRKQAEDALSRSEQHYRTLVETAQEGISLMDLSGNIVYLNGQKAKLFGYEAGELQNTNAFNLIAAGEREKAAGAIKELLSDGKINNFEVQLIRKDGSTFIGEFHLSLIRDGKGQPQYIMDVVSDVTRRKQAEQFLRESEKKYRNIFYNSPLGIFHFSKDGTITDCNEHFIRIIGSSSKSLIGLNMLTQLNNDEVRRAVKLALEKGEGSYNGWYTSVTGNKTTYVRAMFKGIPDDSGKIIAGIGLVEDITLQIQSEAAHRESEEKYRTLIEQSEDAIYLLYNRRLELVNSKFQTMFNISPEQARQENFDIMLLVAPDSRPVVEERIRRIESGEELSPKYEFTAVSTDGREIEVEAAVSYIRYKDGMATQGVLRDITERKRLEEQLRQAQKMEAVGQLAGGVAHDFNNLLTIINGYCDLLLLLDLQQELVNPISQIKMASERAGRLTNQLLTFSRKQIIKPEIVNLNRLIADHTKMLGRLLSESIEIVTNFDPGLWTIKADPGQMEQIIMNIAINARDAMPSGGKLTIETRNAEIIKEDTGQFPGMHTGCYVKLSISDSGLGMDEETRSHIFEPFYTTKERNKGTGLGLATVYGIVKQNNGFIYVFSKRGKGSTFKIFLPRAGEKGRRSKAQKAATEKLTGNETILLVEDDQTVRNVTSASLSYYGYKVITAANGEEALSIYKKHHRNISLVLSDVIMPLMNGREMASNIHKDYPEQKILFFSGYTDNRVVRESILKEGMDFIQKPYSHEELARKVRTLLDS